MEVAIVLGLLFIFMTITFFVVAFFFPEWVGITGKKAEEINKSHHDDTTSN